MKPNEDSGTSTARRLALSSVLTFDEFRPMSSVVRVQFGVRSEIGRERHYNEDDYLIFRLGRNQETLASSLSDRDLPSRFEESAYSALVADGVGGHGPGGVASRTVLATLAHLAMHFGRWNVRVDTRTASEILERAEWFCRRAHDAVIDAGRLNPELTAMATTLTAVYSAGTDLFVAHVGHSRAYLYRNGRLMRLTTDHTVELFTDLTHRPTTVEDGNEDIGHILTDAIGGMTGMPRVYVDHVRVQDEDIVLLCTNGLTDVIDDNHIADVLALRRRPQEQCRALVSLALDAGSPDNVTVLMIQYLVPAT